MNILVTGAKGFVGKNLAAEIRNLCTHEVMEYDQDSDLGLLEQLCEKADFVFHLAGVNRPKDEEEYTTGNVSFTSILLDKLRQSNNACPVMIASSIQAELDNPYGRSKKAGEDLLFSYASSTGAKVLVYRFPNIFGKWSRPNYNSVVATFCHNIARGLPIKINDQSVMMNLVYIDDVVEELVKALEGKESSGGRFCTVSPVYTVSLGEVADILFSFRNSREENYIPDLGDSFTKKLYSTYLSFLPEEQLSYELKSNIDTRGSFTEFIKSTDRGQVSVNIVSPGVTKGNHWHHTKTEKFLVVSGKGVVRFRNINSDKVTEYFVSGDRMEAVDVPPGYTHNLENLGDSELVVIIWASECFDPERPDTFYLEV